MIGLGDRIRQLRQRDGRTQEALANGLGVSPQAVSRWEKGICYPDMEAIPSIAGFFGVSIDEPFGYDNGRSKKADALAGKIREMTRRNNGKDVNISECIALAREALIEFPGNEKLMLALASALYTAGYVRYGEHHMDGEDGYSVYDTERHKKYAEWREAVGLYEKLLPSLPDGEMRQTAAGELSQLYQNTGEHEKALLLAESAPDVTACRAFLRIKAFSGKEEVTACGEALSEMLLRSTELIQRIVFTDRQMPPRIAAEMLNNAVLMFDLVYTDNCFGKNNAWLACLYMLRSYYLWLAEDRDAAFEALDRALICADGYDRLRESSPEFFPAPLLRHVRIHAETMPEHSAFKAELPEVWPWWSVPERNRVKAEMRKDPRWDEWVCRTKD